MLESIWDSVLVAAGLGWEPISADLGSTMDIEGVVVCLWTTLVPDVFGDVKTSSAGDPRGEDRFAFLSGGVALSTVSSTSGLFLFLVSLFSTPPGFNGRAEAVNGVRGPSFDGVGLGFETALVWLEFPT